MDSRLPKASFSVISLDFNIVKALIIGRLNTHVMKPISHKLFPAPMKTKEGNAHTHSNPPSFRLPGREADLNYEFSLKTKKHAVTYV